MLNNPSCTLRGATGCTALSDDERKTRDPGQKAGISGCLFVEGRVGEVHVFLIHLFLSQAETLAEALEMDDLTGA